MVDFNIATGAEQPLNRTGFPDNHVSGADVQGTLVGIQDNGDGTYSLVEADADSSVAIPTVGVLFPEEVVDKDAIPEHALYDLHEQLVEENRTLKGDRATVIFTGIEMVNDDDDTDFDAGKPVYLDVGGGFTQTAPSASGEVVQRVGLALPPNEDGGIGTEQGDRILLDVDLTGFEVLA